MLNKNYAETQSWIDELSKPKPRKKWSDNPTYAKVWEWTERGNGAHFLGDF